MEVLDHMLTDARRLYQQVTATPYERGRLRGQPRELPEKVDPEGYLYQQIAHLRNLLAARTSPFWSSTPLWMPVVDAYEVDDTLVLRVELPGVTRDEVTLSIGESLVVVKGERSFRTEEGKATVLAKERFYGPFERWIPLPYRVKKDADAKFRDGILEVRLQKAEVTVDNAHKVEIR